MRSGLIYAHTKIQKPLKSFLSFSKWSYCLLACLVCPFLFAQPEQKVTIFEKLPVNFGGVSGEDKDVLRLENGRIVVKKVVLPQFVNGAEAGIKLTLKSAGDRWDKSGSCFVITDPSSLSLIDINQSERDYPPGSAVGEGYGGVKLAGSFKPALELLRFMTPFGVGHYSKDDPSDHRKPVYIPHWEKQVVWESDISDLRSQLSGEAYVGIWIDTWTKEGYEVSLELTFDPRPLREKHILPLVNTVSYGRKQRLPDFFAHQELEVRFELDQPMKNAILKYITTGHGGHSGGDEFVKTQNQVFFDNKAVLDTIPWRDDCAAFRRFNPSSGVWLIGDSAQYLDWEAREYKVKYIEERQASSDLSRSNWCPGSKVEPYAIPLDDLSPGKHVLRIRIPAQPAEENKFNHWFVSAYLVHE